MSSLPHSRALFPIRDPITSIDVSMVNLQMVALTLYINFREQPAMLLTYHEAREFLTGCVADQVPIMLFTNGKRELLERYGKDQVIDGQGNVITISEILE